MQHKPHVAISTAVVLTGLSKRTLWRRIADGLLRKIATDRPEEESRLVVEDLLQLGKLELSENEQQTLLRADQGDADAQLTLALLFLRRERPEAAASWFAKAASKVRPMPCTGWARCSPKATASSKTIVWRRNGSARLRPKTTPSPKRRWPPSCPAPSDASHPL